MVQKHSGFELLGDVICTGSGSGLVFGEVYYHGAGSDIVMAAQDTWYQFTGFDTDGVSNNMTPDHTNDHITVLKAGIYLLALSISTKSATADNYKIGVALNNGDTYLAVSDIHVTTIAGAKVEAAAVVALVTLAANDTVEVWAQRTRRLPPVLVI